MIYQAALSKRQWIIVSVFLHYNHDTDIECNVFFDPSVRLQPITSVMNVLLVAPVSVSVVNSGTVFGGGPFEKDRTVLLQNTFL